MHEYLMKDQKDQRSAEIRACSDGAVALTPADLLVMLTSIAGERVDAWLCSNWVVEALDLHASLARGIWCKTGRN